MKFGRNKRIPRLAAALATGLTMLLTGCGEFFTPVNNGGSTGSSSYVYVTNASGTLAEYSLTSGVLAALSGSPVTLPLAPTAIAVSPNNAFVYIGTSTGVFMYTRNSDGTLTEGNDNTVVYLNQSGFAVASMVVDPTSSWLIMAYQNETELDALPIDPTSGLAAATAAYTTTSTFGTLAPKLSISKANNNVFVALGSGGVNAFGFNPTPSTTPWGTSVSIKLATADTSDTAVAIDPTSTYIYVTEADLSASNNVGNVRVIKISNLATDLADYPVGVGPTAALVDPTGAYVYVTNGVDGTITGFTFSTTDQTLTNIGTTFPTGKSPIGIVEDSSKTYVMTVGSGNNPNLWLYSYDATAAGTGTLDVSATTSTASTNPAASNGIAVTF